MMRRGFAALLGAVLLVTSGCGIAERAGAAAIVDGDRYSAQELAAHFRELDEALGNAEKPGTMDDVNRAIIGIVVADKIMDKVSAAENLEVDMSEVAILRENLTKQLGSEEEMLAFAASRGVPPSLLDTVLKQSVFQTELGAKLIGGTDTDAQAEAALAYLRDIAKTMQIEVSPRFGSWDATQLVPVAPIDDLSKSALTQ